MIQNPYNFLSGNQVPFEIWTRIYHYFSCMTKKTQYCLKYVSAKIWKSDESGFWVSGIGIPIMFMPNEIGFPVISIWHFEVKILSHLNLKIG